MESTRARTEKPIPLTKQAPKHRVPFVLASGSPRRKKLLKKVIPHFVVHESRVPEPPPNGKMSVRSYVRDLALKKSRAVARCYSDGMVLGADTVVFRSGRIYGKPKNREEAFSMLSELSGRRHQVYTGLALVLQPGNRVFTEIRRTDVWMKSFTQTQLSRWSAKNHDKAGAYAAQAKGNPFVEKSTGDYDNVVGLPLNAVKVLLKKARNVGFQILL